MYNSQVQLVTIEQEVCSTRAHRNKMMKGQSWNVQRERKQRQAMSKTDKKSSNILES